MKLEKIDYNETDKFYPRLLCDPCGLTMNYLTCLDKYGAPPLKAKYDVSTYHNGKCELCGNEKPVTEARDFFYPDIYERS